MNTAFRSALVLEDNPLIAMDEEAMLKKLDCPEVHVASSVADAESIIGHHAVDFALLDVELDGETSESIASQLLSKKVPFAFVSGYDDACGLHGKFAGIPSLLKPLSDSALQDTLRALGLL
ncbi:MAG: hypothetical protein H6953_13120 [Chromatiaceae bacterium]|nr:hypothetical protein [Gammaproteobacteria bacterium]MCP5306376.1 hypothetical protein [Chromatiaceae bacterium]MCP5311928.1 hypothetical protein [Chromatiaceae bacterium]